MARLFRDPVRCANLVHVPGGTVDGFASEPATFTGLCSARAMWAAVSARGSRDDGLSLRGADGVGFHRATQGCCPFVIVLTENLD